MTVELDRGPIYLAPLTCNEIIAVVADMACTVGHVKSDYRRTAAGWLRHSDRFFLEKF